MIRDVDKARDLYWKRYAGYSPTDYNHRHLMIDSSIFGVKGTVEILAGIVRGMFIDG